MMQKNARLNKRRINQSGMSLVSVMVGISISLAVGLIISESIAQIKKMEVMSDLSVETQSWLRLVELTLLDSRSCTETLKNSGTYPIKPDSLKNNSGFPLKAIWQAPQGSTGSAKELFSIQTDLLGSNRLSLDRIYLSAESNQVFAPNAIARVKINLIIKKNISNKLGGDYLVRSLDMQVRTDSDKNIISCSAVDEARVVELTKTLCQSLGGIYSTALQSPPDGKCDLKKSDQLLEFVCQSWSRPSDKSTQKCTF
jgi:hypothetical protein